MDVNSAVQKAYNKDQEVSELKKKVDSAYSTWQTAQTAADQSQAAYNAKATANAQNKSDVDSTNAAALAKAQAALSDFESNDEKMKAAQDYSEYLTAIAAGMPYAKPTEAESAYLEYQQLKADVAAASSAASTTASDDELKEIDVQNTQNQTAATNAKTEYDNLKSQYDTAVADADTLKTGLTTAERAQLTQLESAADEAVTQYETGQAAADKVATQKVTSQTNTLDSERYRRNRHSRERGGRAGVYRNGGCSHRQSRYDEGNLRDSGGKHCGHRCRNQGGGNNIRHRTGYRGGFRLLHGTDTDTGSADFDKDHNDGDRQYFGFVIFSIIFLFHRNFEIGQGHLQCAGRSRTECPASHRHDCKSQFYPEGKQELPRGSERLHQRRCGERIFRDPCSRGRFGSDADGRSDGGNRCAGRYLHRDYFRQSE